MRDGGFVGGLGLAVGGLDLLDAASSEVSLVTEAAVVLEASPVAPEDAREKAVFIPSGAATALGPRFDAIVHCPPVCMESVSRPGGGCYFRGIK